MSDGKKKNKVKLPKVILDADPKVIRCGCSRYIAAHQKKTKETK